MPNPTMGAKLLKHWRQSKNLSQAALAQLLELSHYMSLSRWERGVVRPGRAYASRLARLSEGAIPVDSWDSTTAD